MNVYIRHCTAFATAYLFSRKSAGNLSAEYLEAGETRLQQLAMDSIAKLFARAEQGSFYKLKHYYEPLLGAIRANPDEALFMTRRLVIAHTKQSMARLFQGNDPSGYRIYRNLSLVHKRDPNINSCKYGAETYLFLWDQPGEAVFPDDLNPSQPEIEWEAALLLHDQTHRGLDTLPAIVHGFLSELNQDPDVRHFICRKVLYKVLKESMGLITIPMEESHFIEDGGHPGSFEITQTDQKVYTDRIKIFLRQNIQQRFVAKSKLEKGAAEAYTGILDLYFEDLLMDGFAGKLPDYLARSAFRDMQPELWKVHRGRLEYLIKIGRIQLQSMYEHDFPNQPEVPIEDS
ncbi:MAG: hypothetical protein L3J79_07900 [Candidatus Marinimicrobia bacterium]|nr:hypothetical protein [Candidatus Neomarinimicrobiota bacterium]